MKQPFTFQIVSMETKMLYLKKRMIVTYDVISPDGEVFENSMISLDRRWIKPAFNLKAKHKWNKVSYNLELNRYEFPDPACSKGEPYQLMDELILMLDVIAIECELLK